ncbi:ribosomal RNA small subunit methyltransferase A [Candidatus Bipolaricaulota bacterium]|nr:ribosomal RNA small subunit methyltransferase A [Candidatus Bipolaricaulota bacterium]
MGLVRSLLTEIGVRPQKRWGQNFLVDQHVVSEILEHVRAKSLNVVVEIGPGLGALTQAIVEVADSVVAVEIDKRLANSLATRLSSHANLEVRNCDILAFDFEKEFKGQSVLVLGSLPYRITTPILRHLIKHRSVISDACLVTQLEVAEKISHSPGKDGSALGVFVHSFAFVSGLRRVRKGSFFPVPEVESAYWEMNFLSSPRFTADEDAFFTVVRTLYRNRRKMARRALQDLLPTDAIPGVLESAEVEGTARGETLSFAELDRLAQVCMPVISLDTEGDDD